MDANTTDKPKTIERTFTSEKEATRFWNRKVPAGLRAITNEIEYNKDRTFTVRKVFVKYQFVKRGR